MHRMQERATTTLWFRLQANVCWGCVRYERQWDPRKCLWKLYTMLELHTELTCSLVHQQPAIHLYGRVTPPLGEPRK